MQFSKLMLLPVLTIFLVIISILALPLEYAWFYVFAPVGLIFCLSSFLLPLVYFKRVPPVARTLMEAKQKNLVPAVIVHDSGRSYLILILERMAEGVVMTSMGKYKLLPQSVDISQALEEVEILDKTTKKEKGSNPQGSTIQKLKAATIDIYGWISHRSFLVGLGLPFYVGYSGSLCLLNPECLALYQAGKLFVPTEKIPEPKEQEDKEKAKPLMWLDPAQIKHIINKRFSTSQIDAIIIDVDKRARLNQMSPTLKLLLIVVLAIAAIGVLAFIFLK